MLKLPPPTNAWQVILVNFSLASHDDRKDHNDHNGKLFNGMQCEICPWGQAIIVRMWTRSYMKRTSHPTSQIPLNIKVIKEMHYIALNTTKIELISSNSTLFHIHIYSWSSESPWKANIYPCLYTLDSTLFLQINRLVLCYFTLNVFKNNSKHVASTSPEIKFHV